MSVALGATPRAIAGAVIGPALRLTALGLVVGVGLIISVASLMRSQLAGVTPVDAVSLLGSASVLALTAVAACAWPVWRAIRLSPVAALRTQ